MRFVGIISTYPGSRPLRRGGYLTWGFILGPSGPSPRGGSPQKGLIRLIRIFSPNFSLTFRGLKLRFLVFSGGPGGFREVREAGRNHFHLSWYLSVSVVTSYARPLTVVKFYDFFLNFRGLKTKVYCLNLGSW